MKSKLKMIGAALSLALFFTLALMPKFADAGLSYRQQPAGSIAHQNLVTNPSTIANPEQVNAQYEYGWRWNGPYTAAVTTGTAGATVINPATADTNLPSGYQGPLKVVFINLSGTLYYGPSSTTYSANNLSYTAANLTGIPLAASVTADTGVIWPGQLWQFQQLATVTQTSSSLYYWVLDKAW